MTLRYLPVTGDESAVFEEHEVSLLDDVTRTVGKFDSLQEVVDYLFGKLPDIWPCDRVALAFVDPDGLRITAHAAAASYGELHLRKGYSEALKGSSLETVIRDGTPRIINDLDGYLSDKPASASTKLVVREGLRSSMTCPLTVDGRNVGLLFVCSREVAAYGDKHLAVFRSLVERLSQVVAKGHAAEQLRLALFNYFEMLGFVAHELKSPVASLVMDAGLLKDGLLGDINDRQKDKLARMAAKGEYLLGLVREFLDLSRVEGGDLSSTPEEIEDFDRDIVAPAEDLVRAAIRDRGMTVCREGIREPVGIVCDPALLKTVMVNLIGNAAKYGREGGRIDIRLSVDGAMLEVAVRNEGPGFPEEQKSLLFRKFSRLRTKSLLKQKGTGIGLYTTWRIIQLHGGRIEADSAEGEWAEFRFLIPLKGAATG